MEGFGKVGMARASLRTHTQATVNTLVNSLVPLVQKIESGEMFTAATAASPAPAAGEGADWEQQKKAMLEGYAEGEEGGEASAPAAAASSDSSDDVERMKAELEEKLRRAEIDISIERAKMHQERRDLEEMQNDLDRQQKKIKSHGPAPSNTPGEEEDEDGEGGGRWSRFLGN